ncbi:MAG: FAD:protein FMN transferase [Opitutaceae bacterium]
MTHPVFQHEAMNTFFEIAVAGQPRDYARHAAQAAFAELERLEEELSRFIDGSHIARANRLAQGESVILSPDALECLLIATDLAIATGRTFDPAYASERPADLDSDLPPYTLDPASHTLTSRAIRLRLDLGAVGKGYALDVMAATLREWGITSACLNSGGSSILTVGEETAGSGGWAVGLGEEEAYRTVPLHDASLSGSGTAVKGSHLIDSRTGRPATRTRRTWALAPTAAQADALSTAFFLMDEPAVAALCAAHGAIGAALTREDGSLATFGALTGASTSP